jgi:PAS domain S-box-containing protein
MEELEPSAEPAAPGPTPAAVEARYRVALANSGVILFEHDTALRYTWISSTQFYDVSRVIGRTDGDLFPAADVSRLVALKERVLKSGQRVSEDVSVTMNGKCYMYLLTVDPIHAASGEIVGLTGASRDVTAAKETEAKLARALEFRDEVAGMLGHDLRSPLHAIVASAQLMLRTAAPGSTDEKRIRIIERSAKRMATMIGTLLDFAQSRFQASLPVNPTPTELGEVVRRVVDEVEAAYAGRSVEVDVAGPVHGTWDTDRLFQVASNLIVNAVKHGDPAGVVQARVRDHDDSVVLEVVNEGRGIPADRMETLFQPFKSRATNSSAERGLGLGLYIADQIVRAHQGTIAVDSSQERTVFRVTLPRHSTS